MLLDETNVRRLERVRRSLTAARQCLESEEGGEEVGAIGIWCSVHRSVIWRDGLPAKGTFTIASGATASFSAMSGGSLTVDVMHSNHIGLDHAGVGMTGSFQSASPRASVGVQATVGFWLVEWQTSAERRAT